MNLVKKKKKKGGSVESADGGEGRKEMGNAAASKRAQEHDTRRLCSVDLLGREARVGRESVGTCVFQREYKKGGTTARKNKNIKKIVALTVGVCKHLHRQEEAGQQLMDVGRARGPASRWHPRLLRC